MSISTALFVPLLTNAITHSASITFGFPQRHLFPLVKDEMKASQKYFFRAKKTQAQLTFA